MSGFEVPEPDDESQEGVGNKVGYKAVENPEGDSAGPSRICFVGQGSR